jgi:hypothetical protein
MSLTAISWNPGAHSLPSSQTVLSVWAMLKQHRESQRMVPIPCPSCYPWSSPTWHANIQE